MDRAWGLYDRALKDQYATQRKINVYRSKLGCDLSHRISPMWLVFGLRLGSGLILRVLIM